MSYGDFSDKLFVKTIDTGEDLMLGGFKVAANQEIAHMVVHFHFNNHLPTIETAKIQIHADELGGSLLFESDVVNLSDVENIAADWIGAVRFDFARQNISKEFYYYPKLVLANYTRGAGYIATVLDYPDETNTISVSSVTSYPTKFEVVGYQR